MLVDFGALYTTTGNIHQIEYAQKCVNNGPTCIGIRYNSGVLLAIEKPIESVLYLPKERIKTITPNIAMTYTGLMSDGDCLAHFLKGNMMQESFEMDESVSPGSAYNRINDFLSFFNTKHGTRPVGCGFLTAIEHKNEYHLLHSDPSAKTLYCDGASVGKGFQRANTELEKLDLCHLSLDSAAENSIRMLYMSYDPLNDKDFNIEIKYIGKESDNKVADYDAVKLRGYISKYNDLSIDE